MAEPIIEGQDVAPAPQTSEEAPEAPTEQVDTGLVEKVTGKVKESLGLNKKEAEEEDFDFDFEDEEDEETSFEQPQPVSDETETPEQAEIRRLRQQLKKEQNRSRSEQTVKQILSRYPHANEDNLKRLAKKGVEEGKLRYEAKRDNAAMKRALEVAGERAEKAIKEALSQANRQVAEVVKETATSWGTPDVGNTPVGDKVSWEQIKDLPMEEKVKLADKLTPRDNTRF